MDAVMFNEIAKEQIAWCVKTAGMKEAEYASNGDRFHNFKVAASIDGETPERALWGMWKKHLVSVKDIIDGTTLNNVPPDALVTEKIGDTIVYMLLLKGMLDERRAANSSL